jgi:hypothetical protein
MLIDLMVVMRMVPMLHRPGHNPCRTITARILVASSQSQSTQLDSCLHRDATTELFDYGMQRKETFWLGSASVICTVLVGWISMLCPRMLPFKPDGCLSLIS